MLIPAANTVWIGLSVYLSIFDLLPFHVNHDTTEMASLLPPLPDISKPNVILLSLAPALLAFILWTIIYRLCLDPLSIYPGPRLAAITKWWRTYKDCVQKVNFTLYLEKLHDVYGRNNVF